MKKKLRIFFTLLVLLLSSCTKDWLDINDDPNTATEVSPKLLINSAMLDYNSNLVDAGINMMLWSQHWAAGSNNDPTFSNKEIYRESGFTTDNTWRTYYVYALKNLKVADEIAASENNSNAQAVCKILSALLFYHLTIMWEDVPYSQALQHNEYPSPAADKQEDILNGVLDVLENALNIMDTDPNSTKHISSLFYLNKDLERDDMVKWEKLANSLKLRTLMILSTREPEKYSSKISALITNNSPLLSSNEDNFLFPYYDETGNKNPFYRIWESYADGAFFFPSHSLVELLKTDDDPRMKIWFEEGDGASEGEYKGVVPGEPLSNVSSRISHQVITPSTPTQLATYSETALFLAEAYAKGFIGGAVDMINADFYYKEGIKASMEFYKVPAEEISLYISNLAALESLDAKVALENIHKQQFKDCFFKPHEGWVQVRRTEVPALKLPRGAVRPGIIKRWYPPSAELLSNDNITFDKNLEQKMWIDKQ
ncbi:MAG: SusD/RagB family nutrient-binding outer membrane lipoprotein [bacterium]